MLGKVGERLEAGRTEDAAISVPSRICKMQATLKMQKYPECSRNAGKKEKGQLIELYRARISSSFHIESFVLETDILAELVGLSVLCSCS